MKNFIYKKQQRAFSLIETLIAVSILMIAIAGPLSLVQAGLFSSIHQRNQVTSIYLAQEALEYVKNIRDTNQYSQYGGNDTDFWLKAPSGESLLLSCGSHEDSSSGCYVDPHGKLPESSFVQSVKDGEDLYLYENKLSDENNNESFSMYSYDSTGTQTQYKRVVTITKISEQEVEVTATINWSDNSLPRTYSVSTHLFNYQIADTSQSPGDVVTSNDFGCVTPPAPYKILRYDPHQTPSMDFDNGMVLPAGTYKVTYNGGAIKYYNKNTWSLNVSYNGDFDQSSGEHIAGYRVQWGGGAGATGIIGSDTQYESVPAVSAGEGGAFVVFSKNEEGGVGVYYDYGNYNTYTHSGYDLTWLGANETGAENGYTNPTFCLTKIQ